VPDTHDRELQELLELLELPDSPETPEEKAALDKRVTTDPERLLREAWERAKREGLDPLPLKPAK
jgi:hypothetical protein